MRAAAPGWPWHRSRRQRPDAARAEQKQAGLSHPEPAQAGGEGGGQGRAEEGRVTALAAALFRDARRPMRSSRLPAAAGPGPLAARDFAKVHPLGCGFARLRRRQATHQTDQKQHVTSVVPFSGIFRFIRNSRGDELGLVELTFYGGLRTSGGTKILLRTDHGAVFVDFGMDFELEGHYFDEPWDPPFYIPSLLQIGALPDIEGLYRMKPGRPVDGVLVSHPHLDHVGHVPLLSPQIPVYAGTDTKALTNIRSETHDHDWKNDWSHTDWRTFSSGDVVDIEGTAISFMPLAVDHSVLGSYGFIIQAEDKKIAYTGDLRLHGRRPEQTEHFLNLLRLNHIDALISEGTHVEPGGRDVEADLVAQMEAVYAHKLGPEAPHRIEVPCITEDDVEARLAEIFRSAEGLVVVESAPIDLDRIFSVWRAAQESRRLLVLPARTGYIIREASRRTQIEELPPVQGTALYLSQLR